MPEILHLNIKGVKDKTNINYKEKVETVQKMLYNVQNTMMLNLQETHLSCQEQIPKVWTQFNHVYHICSTFATNDDRFAGIIMFINKFFEIQSEEILYQGRILLVKAKKKETSDYVNFISIYGKATGSNSDKLEILDVLWEKINSYELENPFIFGDFNYVTSFLDRNSNNFNNSDNVCKEKWNQIESKLKLYDSFRAIYKNRRLYTYSSPTSSKSRIDRIYVPESWYARLVKTVFENVGISDHKIVKTIISANIIKGPGQYVFNNSMLDDITFKEGIKEIINNFKDSVNI